MEDKRILPGAYDSLYNHAAVLKQLTALCERNNVTAVVGENVYTCSARFFDKDVFLGKVKDVAKHDIIRTTVEAGKIGPASAYDMMVIAPTTATVVAKTAHGIYDHPVILSAKTIIHNQRNIVFGIATNDGLGISRADILSPINMRHFYIILSRQDTPFSKERSVVSDWELVE